MTYRVDTVWHTYIWHTYIWHTYIRHTYDIPGRYCMYVCMYNIGIAAVEKISRFVLWHMTYDIRHMTYDIWHMTYDIWHTRYHCPYRHIETSYVLCVWGPCVLCPMSYVLCPMSYVIRVDNGNGSDILYHSCAKVIYGIRYTVYGIWHNRCCHQRPMFLCSYVPMGRVSYVPMFLCSYVPMGRVSYVHMFICSYVHTSLCTIDTIERSWAVCVPVCTCLCLSPGPWLRS
jgi:hypothetical protein